MISILIGGNGFGNGLNQFNKPVGVYFDYLNTNSLYVADSQNNRVIRFPANSTGATNGIIVAGGNGAGSASNQLNWPRSVFVDENGILYITDQSETKFFKYELEKGNICFSILFFLFQIISVFNAGYQMRPVVTPLPAVQWEQHPINCHHLRDFPWMRMGIYS